MYAHYQDREHNLLHQASKNDLLFVDVVCRMGIEVSTFIAWVLVRSLHRYGPKAVTGLLPRPSRGRPTNPWLVGPRRTVL
jgi:hypothetical protein